MGILRQKFRKSSAGAIATYDFIDIAQSTGIIVFYGAVDQSSSGILTNASTYSDKVVTTWVPPIHATNFSLSQDIDFDVVLNAPLNIRGIANVSIPACVNTPAGNTAYIYCHAYLRKWDGTTETDIVSASGAIINNTGSGTANHEFMELIALDVPQTHFKKGETLRLTVEAYSHATAGGMVASIAHDPKNRTPVSPSGSFPSGSPTNLILNLPVKIAL